MFIIARCHVFVYWGLPSRYMSVLLPSFSVLIVLNVGTVTGEMFFLLVIPLIPFFLDNKHFDICMSYFT